MTEHQRLARRVDGINRRLDNLERGQNKRRSPQQSHQSLQAPPFSGGWADEVDVLENVRDVRQVLHGLKNELHSLAHHVNQYMQSADLVDQQDTASQCSGESASTQSIASAQSVAELLRGRGRHHPSRASDRSHSRSSSCHGDELAFQ